MKYSTQYGFSDKYKRMKTHDAPCQINKEQRDAGRERSSGKVVNNGPLYINDGRCVRLA